MSKKPIAYPTLHPGKQPRAATDPTSFHRANPSWRVARMEFADPYGWNTVDATTLTAIREKLGHFESMTWSEILVTGKKRNHSIQISRLSGPAQKRLQQIGQSDLDELVSLRLSGPERIWGILNEGVLTVLWWDPLHQVCPSAN